MIPDTDSSLELFADKLLAQVGASRGEYPAYSERELQYRHRRGGETLECELSSHDQDDARDACREFVWDRRRIRRGFLALARRVVRMTVLTRRQRSVVRLVLAGRSLRGAADVMGVSKTSVERAMHEAVARMREVGNRGQGRGKREQGTGNREQPAGTMTTRLLADSDCRQLTTPWCGRRQSN